MNAKAQLKSAAYAIAAQSGMNAAIKALEQLAAELRSEQWDGKL